MKSVTRCLLPMLAFTLWGCGSDEGPSIAKEVQITAPASIVRGDSSTATLRVLDSKGRELTGRAAAWTVSDPTIARLRVVTDASAVVTGLRGGSADIGVTVDGVSATHRIAVNNPAPAIDSISPRTISAGAGGVAVRIFGRNFISESRAHWEGSARETQFVSATELLVNVPAAQTGSAGQLAIAVQTPEPGGGLSGSMTLAINNAAPALTSLTPTSAAQGSASLDLQLTGAGFSPASRVSWGAEQRVPVFVSATQLRLSLSSADLATARSVAVAVTNPAPGGGSSAVLQFTVVATTPQITSLSPASVVAGTNGLTLGVIGANFTTGSAVEWNGAARPTAFVSATRVNATISAADIAQVGQAEVRVRNGPTTVSEPVNFTIAPNPCAEQRTITVGQTVNGTLTTSSCRLSNGSFVDLWTLTLNAATEVQVDLRSSAFDAFLIIALNNTFIDSDDDGGADTNSRIIITLQPGTYVIAATTFDAGEVGAYQLTVAAPDPCAPRELFTALYATGSLSTSSCIFDGRPVDFWTFSLAQTRDLQIDLTSSALDAYLVLRANNQTIAEADAGGDGTNARLNRSLPAGEYVIGASGRAGESGAYQLRVNVAGDPCSDLRPLAAGQTINGTLAAGCPLGDGTHLQFYEFTINAPATVQIDLTSAAFDPYLFLFNGHTSVAEDDNSGGGNSARIRRAVPAGTYVVIVNSFNPGGAGAYQLSLLVQAPQFSAAAAPDILRVLSHRPQKLISGAARAPGSRRVLPAKAAGRGGR